MHVDIFIHFGKSFYLFCHIINVIFNNHHNGNNYSFIDIYYNVRVEYVKSVKKEIKKNDLCRLLIDILIFYEIFSASSCFPKYY